MKSGSQGKSEPSPKLQSDHPASSPLLNQDALMKAIQFQDWPQVESLCNQVLAFNPNEQRHLYLLALAHINNGNLEAAKSLLPQLDQNLRAEIEAKLNQKETEQSTPEQA